VKINRQGFEKRVVSQDLQLWLSNVSSVSLYFPVRINSALWKFWFYAHVHTQTPPSDGKFVLLARAGRQVNLRSYPFIWP